MTKQQRVTADQLFDLGDTIVKMAGHSKQASQSNVNTELNTALVAVLAAARSAAFNEAQERHTMKTMEAPAENGPVASGDGK